ASPTAVLPSLSSLSFTRTTPLLRLGSFILFDNAELNEWEPARILSVNKQRTRMLIETVIDPPPAAPATKAHKDADNGAAAASAASHRNGAQSATPPATDASPSPTPEYNSSS